MGAYIYYNIDMTQFGNLHPAAARIHEQSLVGMRDHSIVILPFTFQGLVTFPSFHSALALLFIYASMPIRWLVIIAIPLNMLMVLATPVDGGHYLMDVLAGIMIALVAVYATERMFLRPMAAGTP